MQNPLNCGMSGLSKLSNQNHATYLMAKSVGFRSVSISVYSHIFKHNIIYKNRKEIKLEKTQSKAFELATTTVQLLVRGAYLQNMYR